jgi:phosphoribosylformylglycinamidine cyclo-ligase
VGEALLSPTRSYAPVIQTLVKELGSEIKGLIHCSGGAQTKCLKFGVGTHYIKENLFPVPPVFSAIQQASGTSWNEMYKVFNMGHRMEIYLHPSQVDTVLSVADSFNIAAQQIGYTEPAENNHLWLIDTNGDQQTYQ